VPKKFGADNRTILAEAGYSAAEIDTLIASGIAPDKPKAPPKA